MRAERGAFSVEARAFAPGHITCFFSVHGKGATAPLRTGSRGVGFCVESGVETRATAAGAPERAGRTGTLPFRLEVWDNGGAVADPLTTRMSLEALVAQAPSRQPVPGLLTLDNRYTLPIGAGFGVSGACALASALAANEALALGAAFDDCVAAAHTGEVRARSGLGDVVAQAVGGFEVRLREGAPPNGELRSLAAPAVRALLVSFGPIRTGEFLSDPARVARVNEAGDACLARLGPAPTLEAAVRTGWEFATALGLVSPRARALKEAAGPETTGTVAMLGDSLVFLDPPGELAGRARAAGAGYVEMTAIARRGARLLPRHAPSVD